MFWGEEFDSGKGKQNTDVPTRFAPDTRTADLHPDGNVYSARVQHVYMGRVIIVFTVRVLRGLARHGGGADRANRLVRARRM